MTELPISGLGRADGIDPVGRPNPNGAGAPELLLMLRRQRWVLILAALLGLFAGAGHYVTSPDRFYARAVILIDERASDPGQEFATNFPLLRNETAVLNEMQVLRSLALAEDVTRKLALHETDAFVQRPVSLARSTVTGLIAAAKTTFGLGEPVAEQVAPTQDEVILATAQKLQRDLGITRVGRSFSVEVSMVLHDPALAAAITNAYAELYLADRQVASQAASQAGAKWLRQNIAEVRDSADEAARDLAAFRAENRALDQQGARALEQRVASLNTVHATLLERLEMVTIEGSYPLSNGRLLSRAAVPADPALPKSWRLISGGLVLGLLAGLAFAAWRELRETSIRTGEDVRRLSGVPFLGYLPRFSGRRIRRLRPLVTQPLLLEGTPTAVFSRFRPQPKAGVSKVATAGLTEHFSPALYLPSVAPDLAFNEPLKGIIARLDRMSAPGAGSVAAIASLNSGEGRTVLAANLAQFSALSGARTLLIDADMANPALSRQLGFTQGNGLGEILAGKAGLEDCLTTLPATGLKVLPFIQTGPPNGRTHIMRLAEHLETARHLFDRIILDSQPLGASSDVTALLNALDGVVMLADWGKTEQTAMQAAMADDPVLQRKTAGVVLNRTRMHRLAAYGVSRNRTARRRGRRWARS
ncbi:MAG: Wzz/FepE/Etk N-terminal domain-containing protein [Pseudomonadota bacterium]